MQSEWEISSVFIHNSSSKRIESFSLSISNCIKTIKSKKYDLIVFHAQSSLRYMLILLLYNYRFKNKFLYDIHDLNVIKSQCNYSLIRSLIFYFLEFLVLKILKIKAITVSTGISRLLSKRYHIKPLPVVRNISCKINQKFISKNNINNRLVYFGNLDRLKDNFFNFLKINDICIDVYGKYHIKRSNNFLDIAIKNGYVNYKGHYNPRDLSFLKNYTHLYYNINPDNLNFKFSGANKFFQSLLNNLKIIIPDGFDELNYLFKDFKDFIIILNNNNLKSFTKKKYNQEKDFSSLRSYINDLKKDSKFNYIINKN